MLLALWGPATTSSWTWRMPTHMQRRRGNPLNPSAAKRLQTQGAPHQGGTGEALRAGQRRMSPAALRRAGPPRSLTQAAPPTERARGAGGRAGLAPNLAPLLARCGPGAPRAASHIKPCGARRPAPSASRGSRAAGQQLLWSPLRGTQSAAPARARSRRWRSRAVPGRRQLRAAGRQAGASSGSCLLLARRSRPRPSALAQAPGGSQRLPRRGQRRRAGWAQHQGLDQNLVRLARLRRPRGGRARRAGASGGASDRWSHVLRRFWDVCDSWLCAVLDRGCCAFHGICKRLWQAKFWIFVIGMPGALLYMSLAPSSDERSAVPFCDLLQCLHVAGAV